MKTEFGDRETQASPGAASPDPDASRVRTLGDLVERAATLWPHRCAWTFDIDGDALTFVEIEQLTRLLAHRLLASGVTSGDRVGVIAPNSVHFPAAWLALARIGAAMVPINTSYGLADAGHVLSHAGVVSLLTTAEFVDFGRDLRSRVPTLGAVWDLTSLVETLRTQPSPSEPLPHLDGDPVANVQFTSGTTGKPKGCILGHDYWLTISRALTEEFPNIASSDTMLTAQPFSYIDPQWNLVTALRAGAGLVVLDRFHPRSFWQKLRDYQVTYFYCIGLMPSLLLKMPPSNEDRRHRVRVIQASNIPVAHHAALEARWGTPWFEVFGMTETGADTFVGPQEHDELIGSGCIGRPRRHRLAKVVDEDGDRCEAGVTGHLLLRGAGMMRGYFDDGEATAAAWRDGWFITGDLAMQDPAGRFYHRGRTKDMIRRSGENVSAAEVEAVLNSHPLVAMSAVVPRPDELRGEEVFAYVVLTDETIDATIAVDDIVRYARREIASFKVPRYWKTVATLPKTTSEKVDKQTLKSPEMQAGAHDTRADKSHD